MTAAETISAIAAVASAVFGGIALVAAFRSAASAHKAQLSADDSSRRAEFRQLISTAREVGLEAKRTVDAAALAGHSRKDLAIFTGNLGGERPRLAREEYARKEQRAVQIQGEAKLFSDLPSALEKAPPNELDRVLTKLLALLVEVRALRDDLERERAEIENQCDAFRRAALQKGPGQ